MVKTKKVQKISIVKRTKQSVMAWRPVFLGAIFSLVSLCFSLLPSLLPRPWLMQGFVSGLSMALGYGIGLAVSGVTRWFVQKELPSNIKYWAWRLLAVVGPITTVILLVLGYHWQKEVKGLLGMSETGGQQYAQVILSTAVFFLVFMAIGKLVRKMGSKFKRFYDTRLPTRVGLALAIATSTLVIYLFVSGVVFNSFLRVTNNMFGARDKTAPAGVTQPLSKYRSGSKESLIPWSAVGFQGRGFVGDGDKRGPDAAAIQSYTKQPAQEPIRAYAGLDSASTAEKRAQLVVAELKRTGAFNRQVLVVATATGTGWLDPKVVDSIEYMYNGNTAIVSQQYSFLPSWISFLVDQDKARETGRVLYDAVVDEWSQLPADNRPKLLVYGLSLGSFGGQSAFSGVNDIRRSVDGALFVGTPNDTELWRNITDNRDKGSPEWQPVYRGGQTVRFASSKEDITRDSDKWQGKKVLFMQHANDPVVWFNFDTILHKPDWLNEKRGRNVSVATRWYPFVSFLQIGLDQAIAASAPIGQGHYYMDTAVYSWAGVLPPTGWTAEKSASLQKYLDDKTD